MRGDQAARALPLRRLRVAAMACAAAIAMTAGTAAAGRPLPAGPGPGRAVVTATCADPSVTAQPSAHRYLLLCTGEGLPAISLRTSNDLVHWHLADEGLFRETNHPSWAHGDYWGPQLVPDGDRWLLYFTARTADGSHAIGVAEAPTPEGPFVDSGHPLVAEGQSGAIDPYVFTSDGQRYIVWKVDGNSRHRPCEIRIQRLTDDGLRLLGAPRTLLRRDGVVEAPVILEHKGFFYMFVSAGSYRSSTYHVQVYRSRSLDGEWEMAPSPLLVSNQRWYGPGSVTAVRTPVTTAFLWEAFPAGAYTGRREVLLGQLRWDGAGWPVVRAAHSGMTRVQSLGG